MAWNGNVHLITIIGTSQIQSQAKVIHYCNPCHYQSLCMCGYRLGLKTQDPKVGVPQEEGITVLEE